MVDDSYRFYRNSLIKAIKSLGLKVDALIPHNTADADIARNVAWFTPLTKGNAWLRLKPIKIMHHSHIVTKNILLRKRFIEAMQPSIIHMQGISYPLFEMLIGQPLNVPTVVTIHNVVANDLFFYNRPGFLKSVYQKMGFDAFIVHSEGCKSTFCSHFPSLADSVFVIPHGCDESRSVDKKKARLNLNLPIDLYPLILFFGKIREYKGLQYLIRSLRKVAIRFPDVRLVVAGKTLYDKYENYLRIIKEEDVGDKVIERIGYIPEGEGDFYFQAADLVVLPYTRFTSQSGVLMKAYSNQCPAVVTDAGAIGETVTRDFTGVVVPPASAEHLAGGIVKLLSDRGMQMEMKANMLRFAQTEYSWNNIASRTIELYRDVLKASRNGGAH